MTTTDTTKTDGPAETALTAIDDAWQTHESAQQAAADASVALAAAIGIAERAGCSLRRIADRVGSNHVRIMRIRDRHT